MKRFLILPLLLISLFAVSQPNPADLWPTTIYESIAPTVFPVYGTGGFEADNKTPKIDAVTAFGPVRAYADALQYGEVDRSTYPYGVKPVAINPPFTSSHKTDDWFRMMYEAGHRTMLCLQGSLIGQNIGTATKPNKHQAIDVTDDPHDWRSWTAHAALTAQFVLRYGPDTGDSKTNLFVSPRGDFFSTPVLTGTNWVYWFQISNEENFPPPWMGGGLAIDARASAAHTFAVYKAVREVSPTARLVTPSILGANFQWYEDFTTALDEIAAAEGHPPIRDIYLSWHRYHREGGQGQTQGADVGASPELVDAYALGKGFDDLVARYGYLGHMCTETGWNDDPDDRSIKQRAPLQDGFSLSESQGLMYIRQALIYNSLPNYKMTCFYHIVDGYEVYPYWHIGIHYRDRHPLHPNYPGAGDYVPKPSYYIVKEFIDEWGDHFVVPGSFNQLEGIYTVAVESPLGIRTTLAWTDGQAIGDITPMPKPLGPVVVPPPPPPAPERINYGDTVKVIKIKRGQYQVVKP